MSDKPKPCPNPKCKSDDVEVAFPDRGRSYVFCGVCGTRGPSVEGGDEEATYEKAETAWNSLPREGEPAPAMLDDAEPDEIAINLGRFQALLAASGNAPKLEAAMLKRLWRGMISAKDLAELNQFDADIDAYLGLKPKEPST